MAHVWYLNSPGRFSSSIVSMKFLEYGELQSSFPELVANYPKDGSDVIIKNSIVQGMEILNSNLFVGIVRCTLETIKS